MAHILYVVIATIGCFVIGYLLNNPYVWFLVVLYIVTAYMKAWTNYRLIRGGE